MLPEPGERTMTIKPLARIALLAALVPSGASAHADILAGPDPVSAVVHFFGQPDHVLGIAAVGVTALLLSTRFRARVKAVLQRRRRR